MEIQVISVCKTKSKELLALEDDYLKRLPHHFRITVRELSGDRFAKHSPEEQKKLQSGMLSDLSIPPAQLILLDENAKESSTDELARFLLDKKESGVSRLAFAIGGPCGWSEEAKSQAKASLSLSRMTLPYQLVRLVFIEQLYRAFTIHSNLPYHR